jgi:hypothetical protein
MPDSLHTIVALTPMRSASVDSLFKGDDKFVIQYLTNLNQAVPAGADVLYLSADCVDHRVLLYYAASSNTLKSQYKMYLCANPNKILLEFS